MLCLEKFTVKHKEIEEIAGLFESMSHPIRFKVFCLFKERELTVGDDIRRAGKTTDANVSQHLNILRNQSIVSFCKDANFIDNPVVELIRTMENLFFSTTSDKKGGGSRLATHWCLFFILKYFLFITFAG